jgi:predicted peroxiredoxin
LALSQQKEAHTDVPAHQENQVQNEILINITSDVTIDAHSALMGMHLAQKSLELGHEVSLFFNVEAVKLFLPDNEDIAYNGEVLLETLSDIIAEGGEVIICPHCMMEGGVSQDMLIDVVSPSNLATWQNKFSKNLVVFSY